MVKKKICFVEGDISRSGGTERITAEIANSLCKLENKYEIHILSLSKKYKQNFFEIDPNIKMHTLLKKKEINAKNDFFKIIYFIRKYIKNNDIDILIDVDSILDIFSIPATRFCKTKFISWEHFNYYENLGVKYRDIGRKLSAKFADAVVTITEEDKGYFEKNLKLNCPIYSIYNPINLNKNQNSYDNNSKMIMSAGRLTNQKGFDMLIEVADLVLKKHDGWQWIILGEGEDRKLLEKKINEYKLNDKVLLKGNVQNIEQYYQKASMFVLTSRFEGFGLVLTEAKSFHLPTISFSCKAGPKEIIENGVNGFLIDCFDIEEMALKINNLIENDRMRNSFSKNAMSNSGKFEMRKIISQWIKLFDQI